MPAVMLLILAVLPSDPRPVAERVCRAVTNDRWGVREFRVVRMLLNPHESAAMPWPDPKDTRAAEADPYLYVALCKVSQDTGYYGAYPGDLYDCDSELNFYIGLACMRFRIRGLPLGGGHSEQHLRFLWAERKAQAK